MNIMQYTGFGILRRTPDTSAAKMMQCFHFLVEPAKALTAKIKVFFFFFYEGGLTDTSQLQTKRL